MKTHFYNVFQRQLFIHEQRLYNTTVNQKTCNNILILELLQKAFQSHLIKNMHFTKVTHQSDGRNKTCLFAYLLACPVTSMDVLVPALINALNGSDVKISCTFTSCYKLDPSKFAMNWTYQETSNSTEEMVRANEKKTTSMQYSNAHSLVSCLLFKGIVHPNSFILSLFTHPLLFKPL